MVFISGKVVGYSRRSKKGQYNDTLFDVGRRIGPKYACAPVSVENALGGKSGEALWEGRGWEPEERVYLERRLFLRHFRYAEPKYNYVVEKRWAFGKFGCPLVGKRLINGRFEAHSI